MAACSHLRAASFIELEPLHVCTCHSPQIQAFHERIMIDCASKDVYGAANANRARPHGPIELGSAPGVEASVNAMTLLTRLRLFDGTSTLREHVDVLIKDAVIEAIVPAGTPIEGAAVIDCAGLVLMPGLIDVHWHTTLAGITQMDAMSADPAYVHLVAAHEAERTLMRGFTCVRDPGGPAFALKRAIDQGIVVGPRIYPSGAMISQTSGHGDFRQRSEVPRRALSSLSFSEQMGVTCIADGDSEVLRRVREQLMLGASQIKLMAGGGVASLHDPLDSTQFLASELRMAVEAATDWGTYVMVHAYTPRSIQRAIRAGVKSIEHGQLADEDTVRMMADHDIWWSLQPFLQDEDANVYPDAARRESQRLVAAGTLRAYELAQRFNVKTAWGTDVLFNPQNTATQGRQLAKMTRFYAPHDVLNMATRDNSALLGMSGPRNPYPGKLGCIEVGAMADLLVVEGDPTLSLDFLKTPESSIKLIMKDGKIYKKDL
ncbi:metal-dependent hydrolase family protein [Pseudomonas lundensis]|uniref:metal-dependent hydrolase family protein n=1 Tax=Pseudomonas lundensis TaxID=86185 RepID=UPI000BA29998|nr:amidohydrolase family protein [Pseudomonas lundensis]OZY30455.1 hydrolase [Pseudomonas lundensis]